MSSRGRPSSLVEYTIRVKPRLTGVDRNALLAVKFFSDQAVGEAGADGFAVHCDANCSPTVDYRYPLRAGILSYWGAVDVLDLQREMCVPGAQGYLFFTWGHDRAAGVAGAVPPDGRAARRDQRPARPRRPTDPCR